MGARYFSKETGAGGGPTDVFVERDNGSIDELDPRFDLERRSPTGFAWGYSGSGPRQLALAVLADCCSDETALRAHQRFKEDVIAEQDGDGRFELTEEDVRDYLGGTW